MTYCEAQLQNKKNIVCDGAIGKKPLVSVIMIFYNEERFIKEAIESVFNQSYENWELLLVDDGSTDDSTQIAKKYSKQFSKKVYYLEHDNHQNHGMSAARNLGLANVNGKYISFLDADDVWLNHKLEQQVAILESMPNVSMVYGPSLWWYSWTEEKKRIRSDFIQNLGFEGNTIVNPPELLALFLKKQQTIPLPSNIFVRRNVVEKNNGFENAFRGMYEDQAFLAKICLKETVYISGECWLKYRQHSNACTSVALGEKKHHAIRILFLNWLEEYLKNQRSTAYKARSAINKELWPVRHPKMNLFLKKIRRFFRLVKKIFKLIWNKTFRKSLF
jgi:glycosyltransferase involved in cell wall biosynthesis